MNRQAYVLAIASLLYLAGPAAAQDIDRVRALYVAAAYEEALAAMPAATSSVTGTELEQYRALCLLALGREDDARATVEGLVKAHPGFVPHAEDVSPRMRTLFLSVRGALMPEIAKQVYVDAKAAYEAKDREAARAGFQRTLELIDSLPEEDRIALADLRLLAGEFHELSARRAAAPVAPAPAPVPALPAAPEDPIVPAVALRQELPPWNPQDPVARQIDYTGRLRVHIGADGRVTHAEMVEPTHPIYDASVLREARNWMYRPATRGGRPVGSAHEIEIRLRPR
jgi:TonB family protein